MVGLACNGITREQYVGSADLRRLDAIAEFRFQEFTEMSDWDASPRASVTAHRELITFAETLDALILCHGAPRVDDSLLKACPRLRFIGELEGDRFAQRVDVDAAASRGVRVVDTTQSSSYPVAEWALALMLIGLRNAGEAFRDLIAHKPATEQSKPWHERVDGRAELTGRVVGLIGCGHMGRRLLDFLAPFRVKILVHDPYVPREIADIYDLTLTSLENVMSIPEVVVCLAPLTPRTKGMVGSDEIKLLRPGSVFVNVSRGAVVDSDSLVERLKKKDIVACVDAFYPEPIPIDSPIRDLPNVFATPHLAGATPAVRNRYFALMVDELERHIAGHETRYDLTERTMANRRGELAPSS